MAERDKRIQFLTGFSGNRAMALITHERAALWVDPNDVEQADEEVSCEWAIYTNSKHDASIYPLKSYQSVHVCNYGFTGVPKPT